MPYLDGTGKTQLLTMRSVLQCDGAAKCPHEKVMLMSAAAVICRHHVLGDLMGLCAKPLSDRSSKLKMRLKEHPG